MEGRGERRKRWKEREDRWKGGGKGGRDGRRERG